MKKTNPAKELCGAGDHLKNRVKESGVVADGFHRTAFLGLLAAGFLVRRGGLLVNEGITSVVVAFKVVRSGFAAQIAVNALVVHVIFSCNVFGISVCYVSHIESVFKLYQVF